MMIANTLLLTLFSILSACILVSPVSSLPANVEIEYLYNQFYGGQANLRGLIVHMKTDALLTSVVLAEGTNCNLVLALDSQGNPLGSANVTDGVANFLNVLLSNGNDYFIVVGDTNTVCDMMGYSSPVNYETMYLDFIGAFNGHELQGGPYVAIQSLQLELGSVGDVHLVPEFDNNIVVEADFIGEVVSFDMQDYAYLGDISKGFESLPVRVAASNTGNTDLAISVHRTTGSDFFDNLYLAKRLGGDQDEFVNVNDFDIIIPKPDMLGGVRDEHFYIKLDLTDYQGDIPLGENRLGADFKFIAVAV